VWFGFFLYCLIGTIRGDLAEKYDDISMNSWLKWILVQDKSSWIKQQKILAGLTVPILAKIKGGLPWYVKNFQ
jgi:hypothetical protein